MGPVPVSACLGIRFAVWRKGQQVIQFRGNNQQLSRLQGKYQ